MKGFESILGQDGPVRILNRLLKLGKIPHAMLFTGIDGVGKRMTAAALAMALNCMATPMAMPDSETENAQWPRNLNDTTRWACGTCRSCKKIMSGNHPDFLKLEPEGAMIKIDQVRHLIRTVALKPFEATARVVVVAQSHLMNPAAGNALLKVLEEPPDRTILILTAPQTTELLPTIVSRCRHIRFAPLPAHHLQKLLEKHHGMAAGQAAVFAAMADGSYTRAEARAGAGWIEKRDWLIHGGGFDRPEDIKNQDVTSLLAYAEKLAGNKDTALASLDVLETWLRDVAVYRYAPACIVNRDMEKQVRTAAKSPDSTMLFDMILAIEQARKDIRANLNLHLSLDAMMLKMAVA